MSRPLTPIEQKMLKEMQEVEAIHREVFNVELAFLSKPSALVLKDNWYDLFHSFHGDEVIHNCPDFQMLLNNAHAQCNVISVVWQGEDVICDQTGVFIPSICFKKNMISAPLLEGE